MLSKLFIQNYAIIHQIEIQFAEGLNIITGETGAGKSILMGALGLILGDRADTQLLVNAEKKCCIEGSFQIPNKDLINRFLVSHQFDELTQDSAELILRREIAANGKSRAFINDTPASLQQLKSLACLLVDLHQQFDTLSLAESDFQLSVMDALAKNESSLASYQTHYQIWQSLGKELAGLIAQKNNFNKELDYFQFLQDELEEANFKENELEDLDQELKLMSHAEGIKSALSKVHFEMAESEQPLVQTLKQWVHQLNAYAAVHPNLASAIERLTSAQIELQDISDELSQINDSVHYDEKRIEWINQRLGQGYKLLKKHGLQSTQELIELQNQISKKLEKVFSIDHQIAQLELDLEKSFLQLDQLAHQISKARKLAIPGFEKNVNHLLAQVGMPNAKLKLSSALIPHQITGIDAIEFLFDANKSNRFEPIKKVASGGELSRLMLCIKSLVAASIDLATLIFDEIDTGISGEAAKQVGLILKGLSKNRQIICITHQPQIAGKADTHYFVYKEMAGEQLKTSIRLLDTEERVEIIAKMLSGEKPTAAALENAREMLLN